jgi:predicted RNA-binding Zn-ribbon protein involved in translation (DUF1610 family)
MAKILLLDIETAPNTGYIWRLRDNYISSDQIITTSRLLCASLKWAGKPGVLYYSEKTHGRKPMLEAIHKLMDEADVIIHYNGLAFDIPVLHREFLLLSMAPPSPSKHIDLLKTVRKQFDFSSNKLDFVCKQLGLGSKVRHKGMALWHGCLSGDAKSWHVMKKYNIRDVLLLEKLYHRAKPWIVHHPNMALIGAAKRDGCPRCGKRGLVRRGTYRSVTLSYQRYQCKACGGWTKGPRDSEHPKPVHTPV